MTLLKSLAVVSLAPVILAGCASTAKNIDHDLDLVLEPALVSTLKAHAPQTAPKAELVKLDTLTESEHRFNFGKLSTVDEKKTFKWTSNGELSYILKLSHTAADNSKTALIASSTSICGLEPILSESFSDDNSQFTTAVPAGGVSLPITFNSPRRFSGRYRLRSFEASVANVCAPTPGSKFSYKLTAENQRRIEGMFSFNKLFEITQEVTCSTGTEEKTASAIDPSLRGNYLELNCVHVEPGKAPTTAVLAFLLDSGMYLPLKQEVNEYQKNSLRHVSASYR